MKNYTELKSLLEKGPFIAENEEGKIVLFTTEDRCGDFEAMMTELDKQYRAINRITVYDTEYCKDCVIGYKFKRYILI